jgi:hypothetical protein
LPPRATKSWSLGVFLLPLIMREMTRHHPGRASWRRPGTTSGGPGGRFHGYGDGYGHSGIGPAGVILRVPVIPVLPGKLQAA